MSDSTLDPEVDDEQYLFDFTNAPALVGPVGESRFKRVSPGAYLATLYSFKRGQTSGGNPAVNVVLEICEGAEDGVHVGDQFVLMDDPRKQFGYERLHQFFLGLGVKPRPLGDGKTGVAITGAQIKQYVIDAKRQVIIHVADNVLQQKDNPDGTVKYPQRTVSKIVEYEPVDKAAPAAAAAPAQAAAPATTAAPNPAPPVPAAAVAAAPKRTAAAVAASADEDDNPFI